MSAAISATNPPEVHEWTGPTGVKFRDIRSPGGTYYHDTTPPEVVKALDEAIASGASLRLVYGDRETGRSWLDEHHMTGTAGRSMGPIKIPLICGRRSAGGFGILTDCIVRLFVNGREVYRHPKFNVPVLTIRHDPQGNAKWPWVVDADGKEHARENTEAKARRLVAFLTCNRLFR